MDLSSLDITALILNLLALNSAFVVPVTNVSPKNSKTYVREWENDDFLEALSHQDDKNLVTNKMESLSVDEQAAMFRAMMQGQQLSTVSQLPPTKNNNADVGVALTCVEGAIQMYKNSPPELAEGMLMALHTALQSASKTCSRVIDDDFDQTISMEPSIPEIALDPPLRSIHEAVVKRTSEQARSHTPLEVANSKVAENVTANIDDPDSNSALLRKIYDVLDSASGDGKLGLREISFTEASELTDLIGKMRRVLMEELDTGIPKGSPFAATTIPVEKKITSKYQQMLAKARGKKD